jgi:pimeloyl-ACP methyl ester carboxylesterase/DNA-binding CsgD family transcriptional regulator
VGCGAGGGILASVKQVVRFVPTRGGGVAYSAVGSGPPLVYLPGWVSHLGYMWELAEHRRFVEALAGEHTVIRYDRLGCGLSERDRDTFTLDSELEVLEALVEHLRLREFALFGSCDGGQVAAAFAARHPELVTALLVYGSCARGEALAGDPVKASVPALVRAHWGLGSRVLADIWLPDAPAETVAAFAGLQRAAAGAELAARLLELFYRTDVDAILPEIRVPTLVVHRRRSRAVRFELGRELAARIPGAQLAVLEGRAQPIYLEGGDAAAATILSFLRSANGGTANGGSANGGARGGAEGALTARQRQVAALIAEGSTNAQIARELGVSVRTVDAHVEHVRVRLGVRARAQIAVWAAEQRRTLTG